MRHTLLPLLGLACLLVAGCKNDPAAATSPAVPATASGNQPASIAQAASMTPEDLGTLGAQIRKQPNDADKLLAQHGLNEQSFAAAIRKVSEDPAAAKRYTAAYKSAG